MNGGRLLRPLPMFLIVLFIVVAVADILRTAREIPSSPPQLLRAGVLRYEPADPVVDLRLQPAKPPVEVLPIPRLAAGQWSSPSARGVWANGPAARLEIDLAVGDQRVLVVDCLPARGDSTVTRVRARINDVDCGELVPHEGSRLRRLALPLGVLRPGANVIVLDFPDLSATKGPRRALLIRRFGLFRAESADADEINGPPPVSMDISNASVVVRRPGTVELPFSLDNTTDALQMRYRFPSDIGHADVEVAKRGGDGQMDEVILQRSVSAGHQRAGRLRIPLHGRRGEFVFRLRADFESARPGLRLSSLRLVEEGRFRKDPNSKNDPHRQH